MAPRRCSRGDRLILASTATRSCARPAMTRRRSRGCARRARWPSARWDQVESPSRSRLLIEHDLFQEPLHTFPDRALAFEPRPDDRNRDHPNNDRENDRPAGDANVADGLPDFFVVSNLAIALLVAVVPAAHVRLAQVPALAAGPSLASKDVGWSTAPLPLSPLTSRLSENAASAAQSAAAAAAMNTAAGLHFCSSRTPPTTGPTIEPIRPIPSAQPTPVA